jgi:hypothetical protein
VTKRALLVGIDAYAHIRPLDGCVNDVRLMHDILVGTFGFDSTNVTTLVNDLATRAAILEAFDALVASTGPDDIVVIHYAGHGSQMTDREGDEPSGFDSTLMPFDTGRAPHENRDITDDEIHLKLEALASRTSYTTIIVDACHSGTITRDAFGAKTRATEADRRPASALPPSPVPGGTLPRARSGTSGWMPLDGKYVLIAGCQDDEESKEYYPPGGGGPNGALTYFLCQHLRQAVAGTTYRDVFEAVSANVHAYNPAQSPQMQGPSDRAIFGVTDLRPVPFVSVASRDGDEVTVAAGSSHGLTAESTFDVCPAGTKAPGAAVRVGEIAITGVQSFAATGRVTREATVGAIAPGTRAFESSHAHGDLVLSVLMVPAPGPETEALEALVRASTRLRLVTDSRPAAVRVHLLPARAEMSSDVPVPQAGVLPSPRWAVVGETGALLTPLKSLGDESTVAANLETVARCRRVLAIENTDSRSRLHGKFSIDLLRPRPDGALDTIEPDGDGGSMVCLEGETITIRITSRHDKPAHIALVDVGLSGAVSVICQEKLAARASFTVSGPLSFPEGYPFVAGAGGERVEGRETMKLFVTECFVDFHGLQQAGVRSGDAPSAALSSLLAGAVRDDVTRDFTPGPVATDDWTTVLRSFILRRSTAPADRSRR